MKKFNFNFNFFKRFKKSKEEIEEIEDIQDSEHIEDESTDDSDVQFQYQEAEQSINQDRTSTRIPKFDSIPVENQIPEDESEYTSYNTDEFAEKTLGSYNLEKFRKENAHLINDNLNEDPTDHNMTFQEFEAEQEPKKERTKFNIKFPSFNPNAIKDRLANRYTLEKAGSFDWNNSIAKFFSPFNRPKIHGVFLIIFIASITYLIGKGFGLFLSRNDVTKTTSRTTLTPPIHANKSSIQDINTIVSNNLFNAKESDKAQNLPTKKDSKNLICTDAQKPSSENLKLLDTIVLQDSVKSVASVQVRGNSELMNVREGDLVIDEVEVAKINRMRLILKNMKTGECEYIASIDDTPTLDTSMKVLPASRAKTLFMSTNPSIKNEGNSFKIKRSYRDQMISNMSEVLTQARAVQISNPDGSLSFKMTEIVPGSIYSQLNIQEGDIINSINGKKIENLNELMSLLGRIKEIDQFQIGLNRNGTNENLEYGFE